MADTKKLLAEVDRYMALAGQLTKAQIDALKATRDGKVTQRFHEKGNSFRGPYGMHSRTARHLQDLKLIEDVPGQRYIGPVIAHYQQRLTPLGAGILALIEKEGRL